MLAYRGGQIRVIDYTISGFLVGSILKFWGGPRAALVGGTLGKVYIFIRALSAKHHHEL